MILLKPKFIYIKLQKYRFLELFFSNFSQMYFVFIYFFFFDTISHKVIVFSSVLLSPRFQEIDFSYTF